MKKIISLFIFLAIGASARAQLVINEIMQSNVDYITDDRNEFPDSWVELYNSSDQTVDLKDYLLGDTPDASTAWKFSSLQISAKGFVLVYCDKESTGRHTNFRLDADGGSLYLFKDGNIVDSLVDYPEMLAPNIAYGRITNGASQCGFEVTPTPGTGNCGQLCDQLLGKPVFSPEGRVMENTTSYTVTLSLPEDAPAGTVIRYTIDGSEPKSTSSLYQSPIKCTNSRVIRAKLFCDGYQSRRSTTHSYILFPREVTLPVVSLVTQNSYFYDNKFGIYVDGSYSSSGTKNYQYNWRRPLNFEFFEGADQESALNQLCEARVCGGASRGCSLKSLAFFSNKRFGKKKFKYEFFPDQRPGENDFKSFVLRNAGNDFDYLYMRDAIIQRSVSKYADLDWQAYRPTIVFINGVYKGILNLRERGNEFNIYTNYDGLEDVDIAENYNIKEGTWDNLNAFKNFYNEHGHTWEEYSKWMDLEEYINFMAMNFYYNNQDFPGNNFMMWRPRTDDGRWRFIAKDTEYGMGLYDSKYNYKYFNWFYDNSYDSSIAWANTYDGTRLFRRLMEDETFKNRFIDRLAIFMGSILNYDAVWELWEPMYEAIKYEYPYHREPINKWWPNYSNELTKAQNWMKNRTTFFYQHMQEYFSLGPMVQVLVNVDVSPEDRENMKCELNEFALPENIYRGKFFAGHEMRLTAETTDETKQIAGFDIMTVTANGVVTQSFVPGTTYTLEVPETATVKASVVLEEAAGIEMIADALPQEEIVAIFDIRGVRRSQLQPGINILKFKNGTTRKIKF